MKKPGAFAYNECPRCCRRGRLLSETAVPVRAVDLRLCLYEKIQENGVWYLRVNSSDKVSHFLLGQKPASTTTTTTTTTEPTTTTATDIEEIIEDEDPPLVHLPS